MSGRVIYTDNKKALLFLIPTLVAALAFLYYPAAEALFTSLHYTVVFGERTQFVGLENYAQLLNSDRYINSVTVTATFSIVVVIGTMSVSLVISLLIDSVSKYQKFYLVSAIWPYALPPAVAATVFLLLFHPSTGSVNFIIDSLTGVRFDWLSNNHFAFIFISVIAIWKQIGYNVIFMIAALSTIPTEIREATKIDGVGLIKRGIFIYSPLISPTLIFLLVMNTVYAFFGVYPIIDLTTQGGPNGSTNILIYELTRDAFTFGNHDLASAQSVLLFLFVGAIMSFQIYWTDDYVHYGGG